MYETVLLLPSLVILSKNTVIVCSQPQFPMRILNRTRDFQVSVLFALQLWLTTVNKPLALVSWTLLLPYLSTPIANFLLANFVASRTSTELSYGTCITSL